MDPARSTRNSSFVYRVTVTVFCNIIVNFRAFQMPVTTDKINIHFRFLATRPEVSGKMLRFAVFLHSRGCGGFQTDFVSKDIFPDMFGQSGSVRQ